MERTILYLIYSPILMAFKVGISNISNERYATHRRRGWIIMKYWILPNRSVAKDVEKQVLKYLRDKMPESYLKKEDLPQNGYTECFNSRMISSKSVVNLINKEIKKRLDV